MPHHLERVPLVDAGESASPPDSVDPGGGWGGDDDPTPRARPSWWRWVAVAVILAMIVATPIAYALYRLLN